MGPGEIASGRAPAFEKRQCQRSCAGAGQQAASVVVETAPRANATPVGCSLSPAGRGAVVGKVLSRCWLPAAGAAAAGSRGGPPARSRP